MRILVIEPESSGHHFSLYSNILIGEFLSRGFEVVFLTTRKSGLSDQYVRLLAAYPQGVTWITMGDIDGNGNGSFSLLMRQIKLYFWMRKCFRILCVNYEFTHVFIVNIDHIDKVLPLFGALFGNVRFSGVLMNVKFHRRRMFNWVSSRNDCLFELAFFKLIKNPYLDRLFVIDEALLNYLESKSSSNDRLMKICYVPDPSAFSYQDYDRLGISKLYDGDVFWILVYGHISKKKGVAELLRGIDAINGNRVGIIIAGQCETDVLKVIEAYKKSRVKVKVINRFITSQDEIKLFASSNAVWIGYVGTSFGSSGVLYQACSAGLPVIATQYGLIGWVVDKHKCGILVDPNTPSAIGVAIESLMNDKVLYTTLAKNGLALSSEHAPHKFGKAIADSLALS